MTRWAQLSDFSLTMPDRPGALAELAAKLRAADVQLMGLWGYGGQDGENGAARFYCVPTNADAFRRFARSANLDVQEGTTFYLSGTDHVGALLTTLEMIATTGVNLRAIQSVAFNGEFGCFVWADPSDWNVLKRMMV